MNSVNLRRFVALTFLLFFSSAWCVFAQSFQGLDGLPGGTVASLAGDVSANGKVVVGMSNSGAPRHFVGLRWAE